MSDPPSFGMARCQVDGCDWSILTSTALYDKLREHLQDEHDYTDTEWQETRRRLMKAENE